MIYSYQLQTKQDERMGSIKATNSIPDSAKRARGFLQIILLLSLCLLSPTHAFADWPRSLNIVASSIQQPVFRDSLRSTERLRRHEKLTSPDGKFSLIMQGDGNLVFYENGVMQRWATNTVDSGATYAIMQGDGNLVLYTANDVAVWGSGTSSDDSVSGSLLKLQNDGNLVIYREGSGEIWATNKRFANQMLHVHEELISPNGRFNLVLQGDGNLVIYENRARALWASNTTGSGATKLVMQADGNLVLYTAGNFSLWATNTGSNDPALGPVVLLLNNYGNLVIQREPKASIWTSTRVVTTLLATSFEDLDIAKPEEILPLVFRHNNFEFWPNSAYQSFDRIPSYSNWRVDERARTGKYSINILPNGNPPKGDLSMLSNAFLAPTFDVSQYNRIHLDIWLKCSMNRSDAKWEALGDLLFLLRDNMGYWNARTATSIELYDKQGQDGWWEITIDVVPFSDLSTLQMGFIFEQPSLADPDAYFLIDDLKITAE